MCDRQLNNANEMSSIDGQHQLIDAAEIKREPGIKDEPVDVGDIRELPAFNSGTDAQPSIDSNQFHSALEKSTSFAIGEIKIKVKEENGQKGNAINSHQGGHSSANDAQNPHIDQSNGGTRKTKKTSNDNAQRNTLKQHKCNQCEFATKYKSNLNKHLLKHTGEKPFPCDRCTKAFTLKRSLQDHMKIHVNEFFFSCSICLKGFDQKSEKLEHETNCNIRHYECHLCKKSFGSTKPNLTDHMCVHNGEKSFECTECSKRFSRKDSLKRHIKLHVGPLSFRCSKCRQGFTAQNEMIAHQQKCSRRMYECYVCGKFIGSNKRDMEVHMLTHTGDKPFECIQCPMKFTRKSHLNDHMRIHSRSLPWKCVICRQGFTKQSQWKAHQRNCTRRIYECHLCKKFFGPKNANLKDHMMTHSGEKPFQCETCHRRFTKKGNLVQHIKIIHNKMR